MSNILSLIFSFPDKIRRKKQVIRVPLTHTCIGRRVLFPPLFAGTPFTLFLVVYFSLFCCSFSSAACGIDRRTWSPDPPPIYTDIVARVSEYTTITMEHLTGKYHILVFVRMYTV